MHIFCLVAGNGKPVFGSPMSTVMPLLPTTLLTTDFHESTLSFLLHEVNDSLLIKAIFDVREL
jgi:hypothetical protein